MEKWTFKNIMIHHFIPCDKELKQKKKWWTCRPYRRWPFVTLWFSNFWSVAQCRYWFDHSSCPFESHHSTVLNQKLMVTQWKKRPRTMERQLNREKQLQTNLEELQSLAQQRHQNSIKWHKGELEELHNLAIQLWRGYAQYAVINSLSLLKRVNIISLWVASGLHPFNGVPPVTEESCNNMLKEMFACENQGVEPRSRVNSCHWCCKWWRRCWTLQKVVAR